MKDELIKIKTAKLAKEKGFDVPTQKAYDGVPMLCTHTDSVFNTLNYNSELGGNYCSAPSQALLQRWLREVHDIHLDITYSGKQNVEREIEYYVTGRQLSIGIWDSYEKALEKGLQEALKLIK